jgi:antitoxin MazE
VALSSGTSVAKWGNAPAIRIPKSVMQKANLHEGDAVQFEVEGPGVIVVRAARVQRTLEELVAGITRKNQHSETDWGKPLGNEAW